MQTLKRNSPEHTQAIVQRLLNIYDDKGYHELSAALALIGVPSIVSAFQSALLSRGTK